MTFKQGEKLAVLGAGAWGTALAIEAHRSGCDVTLWTRNPDVIAGIHHKRENDVYLKGIPVDPAITVTDDLARAVENADALLLVVPAQVLREFCQQLMGLIPTTMPLIICCKGIEQGSLMLMSEVVESILPANPIAVLSGPNFADEVAKGLPAATTLACTSEALSEELVFAFQCSTFRPYISFDTIGSQIGGAVKNVLAIACGIAEGKKFGENAKAALITRGLAEITRLCVAKGGRAETLIGLSGIGDIMLTCGSIKSRNMSLGFELGAGRRLSEILAERQAVTEGVATAESVVGLAEQLDVDMPICFAVNAILHQGADIDNTIKYLLHRPTGVEM